MIDQKKYIPDLNKIFSQSYKKKNNSEMSRNCCYKKSSGAAQKNRTISLN